MAPRDPRLARSLGVAALAIHASCTVFDGRELPREGGIAGVGDATTRMEGGAACDPSRLGSDAHNCGACGHDCLGGACSIGACQPLVLAQASGTPTDIAIDDAYVFWTSDDGSLGRVAKDGTGGRTIVSGVQGGFDHLAVDASRVYFTSAQNNAVYLAGKDGSGLKVVAASQPGATGVASDGVAVYWTTSNGDTTGEITRGTFAADGGVVVDPFWDAQFPQDIGVDGQNLYWIENYGTIRQMPKDGGRAPVTLTCSSLRIAQFGVDDTTVYWTDHGAEVVRGSAKGDVPINGCDAPTARTFAQERGDAGVFGVAVNAGMLVWTEQNAGLVKAEPSSGSCPTGPCASTIATGQAQPTRAAAAGRAAYWINLGDRTIVKVAF